MKKNWAMLMVATITSLVVVSASTAKASDKGSPAAVAFVFSCMAHLNEWPSPFDFGSCNNLVSVGGGAHGVSPLSPFATTNVSAWFGYNEPCILGTPPTNGFAQGTLNFGSGEVDFGWVRMGAIVVIATVAPRFGHDHIGSGAGVAAFAPLPQGGVGTCADPASLAAIVAGPVVAAGI